MQLLPMIPGRRPSPNAIASKGPAIRPRIGWLDGLRGVAALQVVLLHYASAFLPAIGLLYRPFIHFNWELYFIGTPLFLPFDGYLAVNIFFVLSGVALTHSFSANPFALLRGLVRRAIRLGLPMAAALLFGAILLQWLPNAHLEAADRSGSQLWLGVSAPTSVSVKEIVHQITFEGMFTGYSGNSFLPARLNSWIKPVTSFESFDGPLWTLHIEFCGSLLLLILVALRALAGRWIHLIVCAAFCYYFVATSLFLFVVGHLVTPWLGRASGRGWQIIAGGVLLLAGIKLSYQEEMPHLMVIVLSLLPSPPLGPGLKLVGLQQVLSAILIFAGVALLPLVQRGLETRVMRWPGKISFSLYLTHFPILCTIMSAAFFLLTSRVSYGIAVAAVVIVGIPISLAVASAFEHWVDGPAIQLSRWAGRSGASERVQSPDVAAEESG
jgi:peptidoglycan/LPS O-acetylase OafA/YrhL